MTIYTFLTRIVVVDVNDLITFAYQHVILLLAKKYKCDQEQNYRIKRMIIRRKNFER